MGETIKDKHRLPANPGAFAPPQDAAAMELAVVPEKEAPVQPVPPPQCPSWVPWAQHQHH